MKREPISPYRGLRAGADPGTDTALRAMIFAPRMPARGFYFGRTAAALHGLPLPTRFGTETLLHIGVAAGERRVEALGVIPHHVQISAADIVESRGARLTSVGRTWCDLATSGLTLAELVAAGDRAIWRRAPRTDVAGLRECIDRYSGRRGSRLMRTAVELLSDAADSPPESELRVAIIGAGFPPPAVNEAVDMATERIHPDLSWPDLKIAIEYEGEHHRQDREQWNRDIRRFSTMQDAGWWFYRATAEDYRSPHRLLLWLAQRMPPAMRVRIPRPISPERT